MRNAEHYYDPTPYPAIQNIETGKERKMRVFAAEPRYNRGDIVVNETNGKRCYAVIISSDTINNESRSVTVLNITAGDVGDVKYPVHIALGVPSNAICERPWSVWKENIVEFVRECTEKEMADIDEGLRGAFGLNELSEVDALQDDHETKDEMSDIKALESQNNALADEVEELEERIEKKNAENEQLRLEVESLKNTIRELEDITENAVNAEHNIVSLKAERDTYKAMYENLLEKLLKK